MTTEFVAPQGELTALIAAARNGDGAALELLLGSSRAALRELVALDFPADVQSRVDPSDVVQEVMLEAGRDFGAFQGRNSAEWQAWLHRILSHNLIDVIRRHVSAERRSVRRERSTSPDNTDVGVTAGMAAADSSPSDRAFRNEMAELLKLLQAEMEWQQSHILQLRYWEGKTLSEIAAAMNLPRTNASRLLRKAIAELRRLVAERTGTDDSI